MGTRGVYGFYKGKVSKISYNHFDSYPEGLGQEIVNYIKSHTVEQMSEDFDKITIVKEDEVPTNEQIEKCRNYFDPNVSAGNEKNWYCLLYKAQGNLKAHADIGYMIDASEFLGNSLFCEWGYIINLDNNTLEIYEGGQEEKTTTRYQPITQENEGYWGCAIITSIPFEKIECFYNDFVEKLKQ